MKIKDSKLRAFERRCLLPESYGLNEWQSSILKELNGDRTFLPVFEDEAAAHEIILKYVDCNEPQEWNKHILAPSDCDLMYASCEFVDGVLEPAGITLQFSKLLEKQLDEQFKKEMALKNHEGAEC